MLIVVSIAVCSLSRRVRVDLARFVRLKPEYGILEQYLQRHGLPAGNLVKVLRDINQTIDDPNYEVGISFFMTDAEHLKENLEIIWKSEIESYIEEYFYDQPGKVQPFRW